MPSEPMAAARQLEFFPSRQRSAAERKELIYSKLVGLEYRQQAREQRRRQTQQRRRRRESDAKAANARQLTLDELISRASS